MIYLQSFQNVLHSNVDFEVYQPFPHRCSSFRQEIIQKAKVNTFLLTTEEWFLQGEEEEIKHVQQWTEISHDLL